MSLRRVPSALGLGALTALGALTGGAVLHACGSSGTPPTTSEPEPGEGALLPDGTAFRRADLLTAIAMCVDGEQRAFLEEARALEAASDRDALAARWVSAMQRWQRLEVMQIGPTALPTMPGGDGVRDEIYTWPLFSACSVDQEVAREASPTNVAALGAHLRGLGGIEYLVDYDGPSSCGAGTATHDAFVALGETELSTRRFAHASARAAEVRRRAEDLVHRWDPAGGNFIAEVSNAGRGSRHYPRAQYALNSVSDALFYVDHVVKDLKVGEPSGLRLSCPTETCTDHVESPYSGTSRAHVRENLVAFAMLFEGCGDGSGEDFSGLGFDDLLYAVGVPDVSTRILEAWRGALTALDAIEEPDLAVAIVEDFASVEALHVALRGLADLMRTELVTTLDLELPTSVEGDND